MGRGRPQSACRRDHCDARRRCAERDSSGSLTSAKAAGVGLAATRPALCRALLLHLRGRSLQADGGRGRFRPRSGDAASVRRPQGAVRGQACRPTRRRRARRPDDETHADCRRHLRGRRAWRRLGGERRCALRDAARADGENRAGQDRVLPGVPPSRPISRARSNRRRSLSSLRSGANSSIACSSPEPWSRARKRKWWPASTGLRSSRSTPRMAIASGKDRCSPGSIAPNSTRFWPGTTRRPSGPTRRSTRRRA